MAEQSRFSRYLWMIVGGAAIVRAALHVLSVIDRDVLVAWRLPDDALYYFAIAANLKHVFAGAPLLSYDGIHATNGMHPLWAFVIAPLFSIGLEKWVAIYAALGMQSLLDCAVVWLLGKTVYDALPAVRQENRESAALLAAALYAFNAVCAVRSINGLETTLVALFLLLWYRVTSGVLRGSTSRVSFGLVTAGLLLARTDTVLLILPVCVWLIAQKRSRRVAVQGGIIAALTMAPWFIWNLVTLGTILQSSGLAVPYFALKKYAAMYTPFGMARHLVWEAFRSVLKPWFFAGLLLPLPALVFAWRKRHEGLARINSLFAIGSVVLLVVHSLFRGFVREWYVLMQIPLLLVLFASSVAIVAEPHGLRQGGRLRFALALIVLLLPFAFTAAYRSQTLMVKEGVPIVEHLSPRHRIAALNSGYYGYFAMRSGSVVNMDGVVNYDAYRALRSGHLETYLLSDSVDYVLDFAGDLGGYKGLIDHDLLTDFERDTSYILEGHPEELVLYRRRSAAQKGPLELPETLRTPIR